MRGPLNLRFLGSSATSSVSVLLAPSQYFFVGNENRRRRRRLCCYSGAGTIGQNDCSTNQAAFLTSSFQALCER